MYSISLKWAGNLSRQLEDFMQKSLNFENYWDGVLDVMKKEKDRIFKSEGRSLQINPKWSPLSLTTQLARQRRQGYYKQQPNNPGILRWTWNLQDNIKTTKEKNSCAMEFKADYAEYHQTGKGARKRAVFEFTNDVKTNIMKAIQVQFNKEVGIWNARKGR